MRLDDAKRFTCVRRTHVMILPQRRCCVFITEPNQQLAAARAFDVHVRRLVLAWRRVYVDTKGAFVMHLDHL